GNGMVRRAAALERHGEALSGIQLRREGAAATPVGSAQHQKIVPEVGRHPAEQLLPAWRTVAQDRAAAAIAIADAGVAPANTGIAIPLLTAIDAPGIAVTGSAASAAAANATAGGATATVATVRATRAPRRARGDDERCGQC